MGGFDHFGERDGKGVVIEVDAWKLSQKVVFSREAEKRRVDLERLVWVSKSNRISLWVG